MLAPDTSEQRQVALVVNLRSRHAARRLREARSLFAAAGWTVAAESASRDPRALPAAVQGLIDAGHRRVVVGGGDGSINSVLPCFVGRDAVLGLLPLGTANSFARALGIPLSLDAAVDAITEGRVERVDLGRVDGRYFATVLSVGVAAAVSEALQPSLKHRLGKLSYVYVGAKALARHRPFHCRLQWPQGELEGSVLNLLVANTPYQGGVPLAPRADPRDGQLLVRVVRSHRRSNLLRTWWHALHGRADALPFVEEFTTSRLAIDAVPPQRINADGELVQRTPVQVSVAPRAVAVMLPAGGR
jgi:YegS/Rv2252/BmrU family lipid kinase